MEEMAVPRRGASETSPEPDVKFRGDAGVTLDVEAGEWTWEAADGEQWSQGGLCIPADPEGATQVVATPQHFALDIRSARLCFDSVVRRTAGPRE